MKKLLLTSLFASCAFASVVMAETVMCRFCIYLNNSGSTACAYQCDVTLPDGATMVEGSGSLMQLKADSYQTTALKRSDDHTATQPNSFQIASNAELSANRCRLVGYSNSNTQFAGESGIVASFTVAVDHTIIKNIATGFYNKITVDNVEIVDQDCNVVNDASLKVLLWGDVNGDSRVNASDLTILRKAIRKDASASKYADLNGDNRVNASDVTLLRAAMRLK